MFLIKNGWFSFKNAIFYAIFMCFIEKIPDFSENEIIEIYKRKEVRWTIGKWEQKKMTYRAAVLVIRYYLCKISPSSEIAVFCHFRRFYSFTLVYLLYLSVYMFYPCNGMDFFLYYCIRLIFDTMWYFVMNITTYNVLLSCYLFIIYYHSTVYSANIHLFSIYLLFHYTIILLLHYTFTIYVVTLDTLY